MEKIKVLQLCHDTKGPFISVCAMYLSGFDPERYEVHTLFLRGAYSEQAVTALQGSTVHFANFTGSRLRGLKLKAIRHILRLCRQENFSLIIAHRYKAIYIAGMVSYFTPVAIWGVAHTQNVFAKRGRKLFVQRLRKNIMLVGVSNSVTDNIHCTCPELIDDKRVYSLPNCLHENIENLLLYKQESIKQLALPTLTNGDKPYIFGTIGRLVDEKAHDILIESYAKAGLTDSLLVIIGDGPRLEALQQLAKKLGVSERILFAGHISNAASLLKAFDVFVFSSNDDEAFGVALLEAMAAKLPIICSNAKGPLEVVGDSALIFEQNNIDDLAAKMLAVRQLSQQGRESMGIKGYQQWQSCYTSKPFKTRFSALLKLTKKP